MINSSLFLSLARKVRRSIRRARASARHGYLSGSPILFANSFPKSGTHLLTQVLMGFTRLGAVVDSGLPAVVTFDGASGKPRPVEVILGELTRLRAGDIAYGHLHALPEIVAFFRNESVASFFIYRDPRDVVVSHVHYVTEIEPNHVHHEYYSSVLKNFDERLMTSILGRPGTQAPFPNILARFEPYLGWLHLPEVLSLRYEDMIVDRNTVLLKMINHTENRGFRLCVSRDEAIKLLNAAINPEKSPTFRSGKIGRWRDYFTEEHIRTFKEVSGDLLVRLGYEVKNDW